MNKKKIVFVGLSGGVDSAVSAALLKKAGYEVVGVFIKTWHPEFLVCNEEEERLDAMRVAAFLDIPFLTFDFEDVYKKEVADYMIAEYKIGRTPNPDVMCNKEVKFGAFFKKALAMGADFVATGHYAKIVQIENFSGLLQPSAGTFPVQNSQSVRFLEKGLDPSKDQSYFLWTLKQEQLKHILFPVGNLKKTEVRKLAKKFNLPVAEKKDSQGICFLGAVDLKDFLKHYIKSKKGDVVVLSEVEGENKYKVIGHHNGVVFHTLGERHGFTITKKTPKDGAYYVIGKDMKKNILIVSQKKNAEDFSSGRFRPQGGVKLKNLQHSSFSLEQVNWISEIPKPNKNPAPYGTEGSRSGYTAQIRYHGEFFDCKIKILLKDKAEIIFNKFVQIASGQSVVVYDGDVCLGGGVVI
jgi:tRNA-specific 2-thiouridylase